MTYKEWIEWLKAEWIGREVKYEGSWYKVLDVDYNAMLLIDKPTRFTPDTAIETYRPEEVR